MATIRDLITSKGLFSDGDWVESKDQDPDGEVRLIQLADIGEAHFRDRSNRFLTYDKAIELGCTFLKRDDVLVARMPDPLGRACLFPIEATKCVTAVDVCIVRTGLGVDNHRWLVHWLNSPPVRRKIESLQSGTTRKRISRRNLAKIRFPVPPLAEQKRIADEVEKQFTRLDAAVAGLERIGANLERYKASVLKAACEGRLVPQEADVNPDYEPAGKLLERILEERRRRWEEEEWQKQVERAKKKVEQARRKAAGLPYYFRDMEPADWMDVPEEEYREYLPKSDKWKEKYEEPERPDTDELPELPEGWVWVTFEQVADIASNLVDPTETPTDYHIAPNHIESGSGRLLPYTTVEADGVTSPKHRFYSGQIIYSKIRPYLAKAILVDFSGVCSADMYPIDSFIHAPYLHRYMLSNAFTARASQHQGRTVLPKINQEALSRLPVPVPPLNEQHRISDEVERRLSLVEANEREVRSSLKRSVRLRQSILEQAFSGNLVTQDPNDEPASALLARLDGKQEAVKQPSLPFQGD